MKIVIDIDDDMYKSVVNNDAYVLGDVDWILLENAIANGTPLPEHHGRLIDINVLKNNIHYVPLAPILLQDDYVTYRSVIFADVLDMIPTIIESDKEGSESE